MKSSKGITLISLVITVIVLLILASVAVYSGMGVINSSKLTKFTTELKIMQTHVNTIYQENKNTNIGEEITEGSMGEQANKVFTIAESGISSKEGYRYWSQQFIKELGIEGVEHDFFVNIQQRSVVSCQGFKYDGKTYYTLEQVPYGLYNVKYEDSNTGKPTFSVNYEKIGENKWKINIFNIQYDSYIRKWQVRYQLEEDSNWNITEDMSFVVKREGTYRIMLENEDTKSNIEEITITNT